MATGIPVTVGELVDTPTINSWARGYLRKTTSVTVASSGPSTWVDLLNGEFTLPAGAMGTDKIVRLSAWGDWKQHSTASKDLPAFRLGLGGTTLLDTDTTAVGAAADSTSRYGWRIVCEIQNLGSASIQWATLVGTIVYVYNAAGYTDFTSGGGVTTASSQGRGAYQGGLGGTVNTAVSCALTLHVANAFSHANYETKLYGALVEII